MQGEMLLLLREVVWRRAGVPGDSWFRMPEHAGYVQNKERTHGRLLKDAIGAFPLQVVGG